MKWIDAVIIVTHECICANLRIHTRNKHVARELTANLVRIEDSARGAQIAWLNAVSVRAIVWSPSPSPVRQVEHA
jgi:hypothetical protein